MNQKLFNKKRRVKNFWKAEVCTMFLRPKKTIFVKNYYFGSNLKVDTYTKKII